MQTYVTLDDSLIKEALHYAQVRNHSELLQIALREFIDKHRRQEAPPVSEPKFRRATVIKIHLPTRDSLHER